MAPLLTRDAWPAESVALVVVQTWLRGAWPSKDAQEAWSRDARSLIQGCVLPDLDVLLPNMSSSAEGERFFVAAFADDTDASVLANRIREQFERLPRLKHTGLTLSVSYTMLQALPRDVGASREHVLARMTTLLEESVKSHCIVEAVPS